MESEDSELWRIFYSTSQEHIDADIKRAVTDLNTIGIFLPHTDRRVFDAPPQERALASHTLLVWASAFNRMENVHFELRVKTASSAALWLVQDAQYIDHSKSRGKEIGEAMKAIRRREGLEEDGYWLRGEGPEDYRALEREDEQRDDRIEQTVLPSVMRRYRMDDLAELYERDRLIFEIANEVGKRMERSPSPPQDPELREVWELTGVRADEYFQERFGVDSLRKVQRRVAELWKSVKVGIIPEKFG